jgi:hypothetical protein
MTTQTDVLQARIAQAILKKAANTAASNSSVANTAAVNGDLDVKIAEWQAQITALQAPAPTEEPTNAPE